MVDSNKNGEKERIEYISKIFYSVSNLKRFKIVLELKKGPKNVKQLEDLTESYQGALSRSLKILRMADIVYCEKYYKDARKNYYGLTEKFLNDPISKLILEDFPKIEFRRYS